jgi:hypothetical protein
MDLTSKSLTKGSAGAMTIDGPPPAGDTTFVSWDEGLRTAAASSGCALAPPSAGDRVPPDWGLA